MGLLEKAFAQTAGDVGILRLGFTSGAANWQTLVATIINWVLIIAALVAFFYLIYSGFTYLTAGGNPDAAKKGQQGIINAIIGIVIIFLAFAIVRAVISFTNTGTGTGTGQPGSPCTQPNDCRSNNCNPTTRTCQ